MIFARDYFGSQTWESLSIDGSGMFSNYMTKKGGFSFFLKKMLSKKKSQTPPHYHKRTPPYMPMNLIKVQGKIKRRYQNVLCFSFQKKATSMEN